MRTTIDRFQMASLLENFPRQIEEGVRIGKAFVLPRSLVTDFEKIVFVGMGGSAIGGDVIRSLTSRDFPLPMMMVRHYDLPPFVDAKTLCIFSSYSGNTEETISAFRQGMKKKVKALSISSGGELARLSQKASIPWIEIPKGFPPRAALGYSIFPLLQAFSQLKLLHWDARAVEETTQLLDSLALERERGHISTAEMEDLARRSQRLKWFMLVNGGDLYIETEEIQAYEPEQEKTCYVYHTAEYMKALFPEATILPPVNGEMHHCCIIRKS